MCDTHKWIITLVAHDHPEIPTCVIKERVPIDEDEHLAALLRGGELVAVVRIDSEFIAEAQRVETERSCLR